MHHFFNRFTEGRALQRPEGAAAHTFYGGGAWRIVKKSQLAETVGCWKYFFSLLIYLNLYLALHNYKKTGGLIALLENKLLITGLTIEHLICYLLQLTVTQCVENKVVFKCCNYLFLMCGVHRLRQLFYILVDFFCEIFTTYFIADFLFYSLFHIIIVWIITLIII